MVKVRKEGIILKPTDLEFESQGVFNPACMQIGNNVHMFYRAVKEGNYSSIGYCKLEGPLKVVERSKKPILYPEHKFESQGTEDPRIVFLDGKYYMTYIGYDGKNVKIAYATSTNLKNFTKRGQLLPKITYDRAEDLFKRCGKLKDRYFLFESYYKDKVGKDVLLWDKDAILFPKKINGNFAMMHRVLPDIQIIYFRDFKDLTLDYWENHFSTLCDHIVLESKHWYETRNIGGGAPPIETKKGWLLIYHAVDDMDQGRTYRAGAALLDKKDPRKVLGHLHEPLFSPEEKWEREGVVDNVVFPTGTALFGKKLYIYYGAADKYVAAASVNIDHLLKSLTKKER
ncbi:pesticidal protein Cry7Aa [Candidatus Woesearchaeota archaeon]|nr:pesticidal protein Cry7Aa [Candidatus Woesearchaeota archaeon]